VTMGAPLRSDDVGRALQGVPGIDDIVWATLARLDARRQHHRLVIVSPEAGAGTTVIAAATAIGLLQHRRARVCLVETNVRSPAVARYLGLKNTGLTDVLAGRARFDECLQQPRGCEGVHVLPAGTARAPIPGEFMTEAFRAILDGMVGLADFLVVDAPPLLDHLESRLLLRGTDGALLVLRTGHTTSADFERARAILADAGAPVLGAVFNAYERAGPFDRPPFGHAARPAATAALPADYAWLARAPAAEVQKRPQAGARPAASGAVPPGSISEEAHRRQVEMLERRIAKLTRHLARAEENLVRMAAMRGDDAGIASIYRTVQGLSPEERALAFKQKLMQKIFQANVELRQKLAQQP